MAVIDEKLSFTRRDVDGNEIRFYPETKTKFVTDDNGKSIAELLDGGGGTLKKVAFIGGNIMYGAYANVGQYGQPSAVLSWPLEHEESIAGHFEKLSGAEVWNLSLRDLGYVNVSGYEWNKPNALDVVKSTDFSDVDAVCIFLGYEDWYKNSTLGTFSKTGARAVELVGGAALDGVVYRTQYTNVRVVSSQIYGGFTVEVNDGYSITNAWQCTQEIDVVGLDRDFRINYNYFRYDASDSQEIASYDATRKTLTVEDNGKYTMLTFARTDNGEISPSENIIKSITFSTSEGDEKNAPDIVKDTVVGNMSLILEQIIASNPYCRVVCFSPYNAWAYLEYNQVTIYGNEKNDFALGYKNTAGYTLQELVDAIDKVCKWYGVEHIPLSKSSICNKRNIQKIMTCGYLPTYEAQQHLALDIYNKIK